MYLVVISGCGPIFLVLQLGRTDFGCHGWLADSACYGSLEESPGKGNSKPYLPCQ